MNKRWLHMSLAILVLIQPAARAAAWASVMAAQLDSATNNHAGMSGMDMSGMDMPGMDMPGMDMPGMEMPGMEMPGCHDSEPDVPRCCEAMNGVACGMDCGTASPAVNQALLLSGVNGHGAFVPALSTAAPSSPPGILYKPPRIC